MEPISYAVIDDAGGWLVNLVMWDGDTSKWVPPAGTTAVPASEVNFESLPPKPTSQD